MRVVHVFKDYFPPTRGGIEQHVHDLVHSLDGFEFEVLTSSRSRRTVVEDDAGVRVTRAAEYLRPASTPVTPAWIRILRKMRADLFHFHMPNPFGEMCFLAARPRPRLVATYHADIVGRRTALPFFRPFQRRFLGRAEAIAVGSPALRDSSPALARVRERSVVVPFGVDNDQWARRPPAADEIRASYPLPLLVFLGRLSRYKGVEVLIEAMSDIDAHLAIVGDGPMHAELQCRAATSAARGRIHFAGEIHDTERASYYHAADLFVLPSTTRAEAFGISMLEAMACGTPAVCTEVGTGTSWVNRHGETGLVVPPRSPEALAAAIRALLHDEGRRREMGEAATLRARDRFSRDQMLEGIAALYDSH